MTLCVFGFLQRECQGCVCAAVTNCTVRRRRRLRYQSEQWRRRRSTNSGPPTSVTSLGKEDDYGQLACSPGLVLSGAGLEFQSPFRGA